MTDKLPSIEELTQRIDKAQEESLPPPPQQRSAGMNQATRVGIELFAAVLVGCVLGYGIDRWLDTAPIFLIIFLMLGFAAGVRNVMRAAKTLEQTEDTE